MADLAKGSTILVTGANGFLGSHTADQFLQHGFRVRGTVRDPLKNMWLLDLFDEKYGKGSFELAQVKDMAAENAFEKAIEGVSAVVHTASVVNFDPNPHHVVQATISGATNVLRAAYKEPSVKRFVLTSSAVAAAFPSANIPGPTITEHTWNEDAIKQAWADPPYNVDRSLAVYAASKAQAEQEIWELYSQNRKSRPDLTVNTVLPNMIFGRSLDVKNQGFPSSAGYLVALWNGEVNGVHHMIPPQYFVDVQDCARLHVACTILPQVQSERLFGYAGRFGWNDVLAVMRTIEPTRQLPEDFSGGEDQSVISGRDRAEELLRCLGQLGWTNLTETVKMNLEGTHRKR